MRKGLFSLILMLICTSVNAQRANVKTEKAGTLSEVLTESQKKNLVSLKISGPLNGTDIRLLQCMLHQRNTPDSKRGQLKQLDLENAKIVSGGEAYSVRRITSFSVLDTDFSAVDTDFSAVEPKDDIMEYEIFNECQLESIILPSTLKKIDDEAFRGNKELSYIKIPRSVIEIGRNVFEDCPCLSSINVDSGSNSFISVDGVLFTKDKKRLVHYPCGKIGDYIIPDGTEHIYGAFKGCIYITSITIPKSVKDVIGENDFSGCKFKTVCLQGNVKGAENIPCNEKYIVNDDNPDYSTLDGVLYDKTKKKLLKFPHYCQATSIYNTEIIGSHAFSDCSLLLSLSIDPPTNEIWDCAFERCRNLQSIKISSSVTHIGPYAFVGCDNLLDIYFEGSIPPGYHGLYGKLKPFKIPNPKCILHVPKGSKESYQKLWPRYTVVEE